MCFSQTWADVYFLLQLFKIKFSNILYKKNAVAIWFMRIKYTFFLLENKICMKNNIIIAIEKNIF